MENLNKFLNKWLIHFFHMPEIIISKVTTPAGLGVKGKQIEYFVKAKVNSLFLKNEVYS